MDIKILNLNCWLFPYPFSVKNKDRLDSLIIFIKKTRPDIITLQEVWSNKYIVYLKEHLNEYIFTYSKSKFFNKTGLVTITKDKPSYHKIKSFPLTKSHNFTELIFNKGYIETDVNFLKYRLKIINTHLYAPFSKSAKHITKDQFKSIIKKIDNKSFLCGDFNLDLDEIKELSSNTNILTEGRITRSNKNSYTMKMFNIFFSHRDSSIDHIITKRKLIRFKSKIIKRPLFSDHYAISCEVKL